MRTLTQRLLRCPFDFDGAGFPVVDREEFMGRNSSMDAGTSQTASTETPDDFFGSNEADFLY